MTYKKLNNDNSAFRQQPWNNSNAIAQKKYTHKAKKQKQQKCLHTDPEIHKNMYYE